MVATAVLLVSATLSAARLWPRDQRLVDLVVAFTPLGLVGYAAALVLLLLLLRTARRRRWLGLGALLALAGLVLHVSWLAPAYTAEEAGADPILRVTTLNTLFGRADPDAVLGVVRRDDPGVLVLEEVDEALWAKIEGPLREDLPHVYGWPNGGAAGTITLSRWRLTERRQLPGVNGIFSMRVQAPLRFRLLAVHTTQPIAGHAAWLADLEMLRRELGRDDGPVIATGDFNATVDHRPMRRLLGSRLRDAAERSGAGFQPTWPSDGQASVLGVPVPVSLITLDHVLVDGFAVIGTSTLEVPGSDHRAVTAALVPR